MPQTYKEYLVTCLAEEANEIGQMACKVLRFYDVETMKCIVPSDRIDGKEGNALELLMFEIRDVFAVIEMLNEEGVLPDNLLYVNCKTIIEKKRRVKKYWDKVLKGRKK